MKTELLHERLLRLRKDKKLTAKAMAQSIAVPESTYREWENGRGLRLPPFQKISHVLSISVTELLTGEKPETAQLIEELGDIEKCIADLRRKVGARI